MTSTTPPKAPKTKAPVQQVFFSTAQTAQLLGVSKKTLYPLFKSGKLPHIRVGRVIRVNVNDLKALIHEYKQIVAAQAAEGGADE